MTSTTSSHANQTAGTTSSNPVPAIPTTYSTSGSDSFPGGVCNTSANVRSDTKSSSVSSREVFDISLEKEEEELETCDNVSTPKPQLENRIAPPSQYSGSSNVDNSTVNKAVDSDSRKLSIEEFRPKLHSSSHSNVSSSHSYTSSTHSPSSSHRSTSNPASKQGVAQTSSNSNLAKIVNEGDDDDEDIVEALVESMAQFADAEPDSPKNGRTDAEKTSQTTTSSPTNNSKDSNETSANSVNTESDPILSSSHTSEPTPTTNQQTLSTSSSPITTATTCTSTDPDYLASTSTNTPVVSSSDASTATPIPVLVLPDSVHHSTNTDDPPPSEDASTVTMTPRVHCMHTQTSVDCEPRYTQTAVVTPVDTRPQCTSTSTSTSSSPDAEWNLPGEECRKCLVYANAVQELRGDLDQCRKEVVDWKDGTAEIVFDVQDNLHKQLNIRESTFGNLQVCISKYV